MKRAFLALAVLASLSIFTPAASAQVTTNPIRYTWIASSCETWNCAAAALILAGGDKHVLVMPTGVEERPWVILRRVEEGSVFIPEEEPFGCEVFTSMGAATTRFEAMESCHAPLVLNTPDGRAVVASLLKCPTTNQKQRAVRR